jgi:copper chaperone NosL
MNKPASLNLRRELQKLCLFLLLIAPWLSGCGQPKLEPVEIAAEDMCAFCRMAISERRYAAEFLNQDGDAFKFDDIGCLVSYLKAKQSRSDVAAYFVVDYEARQWINAEQAYFVRSEEFKTPMSGRLVAFSDRSKAEEAAAKYHGKLLGFSELFSR